MLRYVDRIPLMYLEILAMFQGPVQFFPEPHLFEKPKY